MTAHLPTSLSVRRMTLLLLATVLAIASVVVAAPRGIAQDQPPPLDELDGPFGTTDRAPADPTAVTLVTGDRVVLSHDADGRPSAVVESAEDHWTRRLGDDLYVVPARAEEALAAGTLDLELFNVTSLVAQGYDDTTRTDLPLIVSGTVPSTDGVTTDADLESIDATAVSLDKEQAADAFDALVASDVETVWLDAMVQPMDVLDPGTGVEQTGAPDAWDLGYDGDGMKVAVLDTGYDADHPDLVGQVTATADFTGRGMADSTGHGTHVASTVAGSGAADPTRVGMAPDADLLIGHVLGPTGGETSWIIDGMEWAVEQGADVVNMSLGSPQPTDCTDPMSVATQQLIDESDTLFVIAAGNNGLRETVTSPGCVEGALTVAAVDASGATAGFSSRGATFADHRVKPDIGAPGVGIVGARAGSPGGIDHVEMSGTSMASPHVAGAAALVRQANPGWTSHQVKAALTSSVKPDADGTVHEVGAGELWVPAALDIPVTTEPSIELAEFDWPHGKDERVTESVTYTNDSDSDVVLHVAVDEVTGADGEPIAASVVQVPSSRLVVPANGTASVDVSVRGDIGNLRSTAYGEVGARLVATGDGADGPVHVTTAVGLWLEPEMVDVTFRLLDRNGEPASSGLLDVTDLHQPSRFALAFAGQDLTTRLRAGSHFVSAFIRTPGEDGTTTSYVGIPEAVVTEDTEIVLDAREATEVRVAGDRPIELVSGTLGVHRTFDGFQVQAGMMVGNGRMFAAPTHRPKTGTFTFGSYVRGQGAEATYHLALVDEGRVAGDQAHRVRDRDLARVTEHWSAQRDGWLALESTRFVPGGGLDPFATAGLVPLEVPTDRTSYHSPGNWQTVATSGGSRGETWFDPVRSHAAGDTDEVDWFRLPTNTGLHVDADGSAGRIAERQGSLIGFDFAQWQDTEPGRVGLPGFRDVGFLDIFNDGEHVGRSVFPRGQLDIAAGTHEVEVHVGQLRTARNDTWDIGRGTVSRFRFTTDQPEGDEVVALPIALPRYDAPVDGFNRAPATTEFPVSVSFTGQRGYDPGELASFRARVTFEPIDIFADTQPEAYTWTEVEVVESDGTWTALVDNSDVASGTTASLWIDAVDANGTATEQFVIDLYSVQ